MKQSKLLKTFFVLMLFVTINMMGQNNVKTIQSLYTAFEVGDIPKVLAGLDEKVVWNEAEGNKYADGNPYNGPQAVLNGVFARIGADYEYFKLVNIQLHEMSDNQVFATLRYQAKLKKNGATYDAQVAHLWTVKNGKAIAFQQYLDTKKVADAIAK
ncbi:nuclear transport factor 2 family protein [Flavobacterium sp.]|uniref:nuclear transport factor 2 family protein n=1 Tax=Flavobacterium sp. TaxID=239 RepID=UPI0025E21A7D|nr:nuclear transport factor 2 family protein [Flavobacterium sp.]